MDDLEIEVHELFFEDDGRIPNNPEVPLLVYPGVLGESELEPSRRKELPTGNGWGGASVIELDLVSETLISP